MSESGKELGFSVVTRHRWAWIGKQAPELGYTAGLWSSRAFFESRQGPRQIWVEPEKGKSSHLSSSLGPKKGASTLTITLEQNPIWTELQP